MSRLIGSVAKVVIFLYRVPVMSNFGPLANPRLCVFADGSAVRYKWQILFLTVASGHYSFHAVKASLEQLSLVWLQALPWHPESTRRRFVLKRRIFVSFKTKNLCECHLNALMHSPVHYGISQTMFTIQLGTSLGIHAGLAGALAMISVS